MSLRLTATDDLNKILESDFGWPITITDPSDTTVELSGYSNDIAQTIDPDTGQIISGRIATIAFSLRALTDAGLGIPIGIEDNTIKPWRITFQDTDLVSYRFKVQSSNPDRTLGIVTCELKLYND